MLSLLEHTRVGQPDNQGNSHREARLSGRMPQIAPRRFAVGANTVRSTKGARRTCADRSIIQNGKLVGAVTHVMVADPTEGYGIFIENMLNAAESQAMPKAA